jgi:AcrR family transcriptional regulator
MPSSSSKRHRLSRKDPGRNDFAFRRIVRAARRYFLAQGFRRITMDDLAEELGMSKKTLYLAFEGKRALLEAVLFDKFSEIDADLHRVTSDCSDVPAALHRLLACVQRHTDEIQPPFVRDMRREPELFEIIETRRRDMILRHFSKLLEEGRKAGIIRKEIATIHIVEILLAAVHALLNPRKMADLDLTPRSGFSTIIRVMLEGVLTESGRKKYEGR